MTREIPKSPQSKANNSGAGYEAAWSCRVSGVIMLKRLGTLALDATKPYFKHSSLAGSAQASYMGVSEN